MRTIITLALAVATVWLAFKYLQANKTIAELSQRQAVLKQAVLDETPSFEMQSRCAEYAKQFFTRNGFGVDDDIQKGVQAEYVNHYNAKLRKCFITVKTFKWDAAQKAQLTTTDVYDAVEGRTYGEYTWESQQGKKYFEVPPIYCKATKPDGTEVFCKDEDEYTALMSNYMDIYK